MQLGKGRGRGVEQPRGRGGRSGVGQGGRGGGGRGSDNYQEGNKVCLSYNGFYTGNGCAYEYNNNRKCGYEHFCSTCFEKTGNKEDHKAYYCQLGSTNVTGATKPAVTTSG